jgi:hypothetical protein
MESSLESVPYLNVGTGGLTPQSRIDVQGFIRAGIEIEEGNYSETAVQPNGNSQTM